MATASDQYRGDVPGEGAEPGYNAARSSDYGDDWYSTWYDPDAYWDQYSTTTVLVSEAEGDRDQLSLYVAIVAGVLVLCIGAGCAAWCAFCARPPREPEPEAAVAKGSSSSSVEATDSVVVDIPAATGSKPEPEPAATARRRTVSFRRLYRFATPLDWALLAVGTMCAAMIGLVWPAFYVVLGEVLDAFVYSEDVVHEVSRLCAVLAAIGASAMVAGFGSLACWMLLGERAANAVRVRFLESVLAQEQGWYDNRNAGATIGAGFTLDIVEYYKGTGERVATLITCCVGFAGGLAVGVWKGWQLALLVLLISPLHGGGISRLAALVSKIDELVLELATRASSVVLESVAGIRTVKAFNGQRREFRRFAARVDEASAAGVRKAVLTGIEHGLTWFSIFVTYGLALWFGAYLIRTNAENEVQGRQYTGGDVVTTFWAVLIAAMTIGEIGPCWSAMNGSCRAAYRLYETIDRRPAVTTNAATGGARLTPLAGRIEFAGVRFSYPTRPGVEVLVGLDLVAEAGKKIALVGASGQGKSTVLCLLQRFYDVAGGRLTVDGVELRDIDLTWWRQSIAVVSQQPGLMLGSVLDNIRLGMPDATVDQVIAAATAANAHDFIVQLPYGYDSFVGEGGALLSGGQKQRIAIARAMLRDPKVLLLDEATSALDNHNERLVQASLDKLMAGRTTLVVAHRLSTIMNADKICVFDGGRVVEEGTHAELLALGGRYTSLAADQFTLDVPAPEPRPRSAKGGPSSPTHHSAPTAPALPPRKSRIRGIASHTMFGSDTLKRSTENRAHSILKASYKMYDTATETPVSADVFSSIVGETNDPIYENVHPTANSPVAHPTSSSVVLNTTNTALPSRTPVEPSAAPWLSSPNESVSISRVLTYIDESVGWWSMAGIGSAAIGAHMPVWSIVFGGMVAVLYEEDPEIQLRDSTSYAIIFAALGAVFFVAAIAQDWGLGVVGERLAAALKKASFNSILQQELGWFDLWENNSYTVNQRLTTNTTMVQTATIKPIGFGIQAVATLISGLSIAFYFGWKLALVCTTMLPLLVGCAMVQYKYILSFSGEEKTAFEYAGAIAANALTNARTVQAAVAESTVLSAFASKLEITQQIGLRRALISGACFGLFYLVVCGAYALAFWYAAVLVADGQISFEDAMVVIFAIVVAAIDVGQNAAKLLPGLGTATEAQKELFRMIDRVPAIAEPTADPTCTKLAGKVTAVPNNGFGKSAPDLPGDQAVVASFRDVHFAYPARPLAPVLKGLTLDVKRGETVAVVGASGGGKSTLFNLWARFYDQSCGRVTINGCDVQAQDVGDLRSYLGLVGQDPFLFDGTIADNISYGFDEEIPRKRIELAAAQAGALEFISSLPGGFEASVAGVNLSGGQKQRIAIARTLLREPKLLLLDEATSALDSESEALVQRALDELMKSPDQSVVVIAHRLATVKNADRIAVVSNGIIAEVGSHRELLELPNGLYAALVQASLR